MFLHNVLRLTPKKFGKRVAKEYQNEDSKPNSPSGAKDYHSRFSNSSIGGDPLKITSIANTSCDKPELKDFEKKIEEISVSSLFTDLKEIVLDTFVVKKNSCKSGSFRTIVSKRDKKSSFSVLFASEFQHENRKQIVSLTSKHDNGKKDQKYNSEEDHYHKQEVFLQFVCSRKRNLGEKEFWVDILTYPNLTKTRWDELGKIKLKLSGSNSGNVEVFDRYGKMIYQVVDLDNLPTTDMNAISKKCIDEKFLVHLNIVNRDEQKVGSIELLGDSGIRDVTYTQGHRLIDQFQSKIVFPVEDTCIHKDKHKALLLAVPGVCRWYFRRKKCCKHNYPLII